MTAPAETMSSRRSQGGQIASVVFLLEFLESIGLGILVAAGGLLLGRIHPEQVPRIVLGFAAGYVVLLVMSFLWQHSRFARILLTWLSLGVVFFFLIVRPSDPASPKRPGPGS
jgi:hypothetical protein